MGAFFLFGALICY